MRVQIHEAQNRLKDQVINTGLCVRCGACVGLCPYFDYHDGKVVVQDPCHSDTGRCFQICPRADYPDTVPPEMMNLAPTDPLGSVQKVAMVRSKEKDIRSRAQYGGVVSALLIYALGRGNIRSAVLTDSGHGRSPKGQIARDPSEVLACAGSRYSASASLSELNRVLASGEEDVGVVGLPCQMEAIARIGLMEPDGEERNGRIALKIGLFCTWALDYRPFRGFLEKARLGDAIKKFDIPPPPSEKLQIKTGQEWRDFPLDHVRPYIQKGCTLCEDMTALCSDISVGTAEGQEGWNTLLIRTDLGLALFNDALDDKVLESKPLPENNLEHLKEAARGKRERGKKAKGVGV